MPLDALHRAMATPMITAVSEPCDDRLVAECTASVNTPLAPWGSAVVRPLTRRVTVPPPRCSGPVRPSRAMRAGKRARNQW